MAIMFEFSTILLVLLVIVGLVIPFYTLKSGKTKTTKECPECEEEISSDAKISILLAINNGSSPPSIMRANQ